jgi:two-component system nitrogen regulation response regulator GlnG
LSTATPTAVTAPRTLVADDEPSIRFVLRESLEELGCEVSDVEDGDAALEALSTGAYELAFLDIRMPGATGLELLDRCSELSISTAVVIITAQNTFENAVEAMKRGAMDYLVKPFGIREVEALVEKSKRARALERELVELRREAGQRVVSGDRLVGKSAELLEIFKTIGRVARSEVSVLITGESGTGKELVARAIHAASPRGGAPFVAVNTAAIPRELLESELFGHERGAFTGAVAARPGRFREASGGTLFLDEIGDMSPDLQAKILRVLQDSEVTPVGGSSPIVTDVRIVAATHRDLDQAVREERFREDLLYRLRVVPVHMPALRERKDDVRVLAEHFVARYSEELTDGRHLLADTALVLLEAHDWPGNVRELENAIKRALVLSTSELLTRRDFSFLAARPDGKELSASLEKLVAEEAEAALSAGGGEVYREVMERVERPLIESVLLRTEGNQIRAAALLGINRNTLRKKIALLRIPLPDRS